MALTTHAQKLLQQGVEYGQRKEYENAAAVFQQLVHVVPDNAEGHFNLGVAYRFLKRHHDAVQAFERAASCKPESPEIAFNLGNSYRDIGDRQKAIHSFERAVALQPTYCKALNNLANLYYEQGLLSQAKTLLGRAIAYQPNYAEAHFNLGRVFRRQKRVDFALEATANAVRFQPANTRYRLKLAELQKVRGQHQAAQQSLEQVLASEPLNATAILQRVTILRDENRDAEALQLLSDFDRRGAVNADLLWHRADLLRTMGREDEAIEVLQKSIAINPRIAMAHNLLGVIWFAKGEPQRAVVCYDRAIALKADQAEIHSNRGAALQALRRYKDSDDSFEMALRLKPDFSVARLNRALSKLRDGEFPEGWREFEWRFLCHDYRLSFNNRPVWTGEPLPQGTVLLRSEQGLGDTLQFVRYAALVKERCGRVVVECQSPVKELVSRCPGVDAAFARGEPLPHVDAQIPLMSLPMVLGTTLATVPACVPYLRANDEWIAHWRQKLSVYAGLNVGISWQGNRKFQGDALRSVALKHFAPLAQAGVSLLSLQKNEGTEQLSEPRQFCVEHFEKELDTSGAFRDTAAIMTVADLIITSDTAVAHLAGALGRPVWVALPYSADWRWLASGETSPWYPTMRLFRQPQFRDWDSVFEAMAAELSAVLAGDRTRLLPAPTPTAIPAMRIEVAPGELLDKITILEIKAERITDAKKLANVRHELLLLRSAATTTLADNPRLHELMLALRTVNQQLWDIEDEIRHCERAQDFGTRFTQLARSVYQRNDERASLKKQMNRLLGSAIVEEKSYAPTTPSRKVTG